jgi:hypothetical protein
MTEYYLSRVAPFGYLRLSACLTAPRSFSQLATPFVASLRLGILHTPFVACPSSLHVELPRAYTRSSSSSCPVKELFLNPYMSIESRERNFTLLSKSHSELGGGEEERCQLRKEVIQPQVPLRLPCYDFTPVTSRTLGSCLPCRLARSLPVQPTPMV